MHPAPAVGTFHAAGSRSSYQVFGWFAAVGRRSASTGKVVVSKDAMELVQSRPRRRLRHPLQRRRDRRDRRRADRRRRAPDDLLLRSPRGAQGSGRPARGVHPPARRRSPVDRQRRACTVRGCAWSTPATSASPGSAASARRRSSPACAGRRCSARRRCTASRSASCSSRPWRPARRSWPAASTAIATWRPTASMPCSCRRATWPRSQAALSGVLGDAELAETLRAAGRRRAGDFSMRTLAGEYVRIYRHLLARPSRHPPGGAGAGWSVTAPLVHSTS